MSDERRRFPRAPIPGARVTYASATGGRLKARGLDLGKGGLFIQTNTPMPVGKRLSLEIEVPGQLAPWPALGRVLWVREAGGDDPRPPGMGVAFIDIEDAVLAAIDRVLLKRGPAERIVKSESGSGRAPSRERTVLGVGLPAQAEVPAVPIVAAAPSRERTVLGVGTAAPDAVAPAIPPIDIDDESAWEEKSPQDEPQAPAPPPKPEPTTAARAIQRSVVIDLVSKKPASMRPAPETAREDSLAPAAVPKQGRGGWLFFLLLVASAAGGGYAFRDRLRPFVERYSRYATTPTPVVSTSTTSLPVAMSVASTTGESGSPPAPAGPSASRGPGVGTIPGNASARPSPSAVMPPMRHPPASTAPKAAPSATTRSSQDNPY